MSLLGHYWTLVPHFTKAVRPPVLPASRLFSTMVEDPIVGPVRLTGRFSDCAGAKDLLVVLHGLGGSVQSKYVFASAAAATAAGLSCLRLNLRGADRLGEDYFHAGLASDVTTALNAPALSSFRHIYVLGFSIGGHVALRFALEGAAPRVRAVASICSPLDLDASAGEIDRKRRTGYRRYVLKGMKEMYEAVARRRSVPIPVEEARRIDSLRDWDTRVVAPRHGFSDARDYYGKVSVGPHLRDIQLPALLVQTKYDPMIPEHTVRPSIDRARSPVTVEWVERGGHVGFPGDFDLGLRAPLGLEPQVIAWLERHA